MTSSGRFATLSLVSAALAGLTAWMVVRESAGSDWDLLPYCAAAAAAVLFPLCWRIYFGRRPAGPWRGAIVGSVASTLAHPLAWYLMICLMWALVRSGLRPMSVAGEPLNPWTGIPGAAVFTFWSVLVAGWITLPVGALLGALFGAAERKEKTSRGPTVS